MVQFNSYCVPASTSLCQVVLASVEYLGSWTFCFVLFYYILCLLSIHMSVTKSLHHILHCYFCLGATTVHAQDLLLVLQRSETRPIRLGRWNGVLGSDPDWLHAKPLPFPLFSLWPFITSYLECLWWATWCHLRGIDAYIFES